MEKSLAPLFILEILKEYSDENHPLKQQDIIDKMETEYDITLERKAVARNLTNLEIVGYGIERTRNGVYLVDNDGFSDSELRLLIDSVLFSKHISGDAAESLIKKLKKLGSTSLKGKNTSIYSAKLITREDNDCLYENIDMLGKAIEAGNRVAFHYCEYGIDKKLHKCFENKRIVDPYRLMTANNHYYLIGKDTQTNAVFPFRLEKIVEIDNLNIPRDNVKGRIDFDLDKYINENPYLLGGDITSVEMNISKDAIGEIIDAFGKDFSLLADYGDAVKIKFYASLADAFDWIKRFGNIAEVVSPQCLRNKIREYCSITYDKYCISDDDRYSKELTDEFERNDHHVLRLENIDLRNKNEYKNYKDVKKLILKNNNLTDVSFLSEFKNLTSLTIDNNPIEDFGFLAQMTELKELTILNLEGVDERYIKHEKEYDLSAIYNIWGLQLLTVSPEIASDLNVLELKRSCPNLQIKIDGIQGGFISIIEMIDLFTRNVDIDKLEVIISRFPIRRRDVYLDIESKEIAERAVEFAKSKSVFTEEDLHNSLNFKSYENRPPKMLIDWMIACEYIERIAANLYKFIG